MCLPLLDIRTRITRMNTEWLARIVDAGRKGNYPTSSHVKEAKDELGYRVPKGCLLIWEEKKT